MAWPKISKFWYVFTGGAAAIVLVAACGSAPTSSQSETNPNYGTGLTTRTVALPDGRSILCVVSTDGDAGGVSCDWGNE